MPHQDKTKAFKELNSCRKFEYFNLHSRHGIGMNNTATSTINIKAQSPINMLENVKGVKRSYNTTSSTRPSSSANSLIENIKSNLNSKMTNLSEHFYEKYLIFRIYYIGLSWRTFMYQFSIVKINIFEFLKNKFIVSTSGGITICPSYYINSMVKKWNGKFHEKSKFRIDLSGSFYFVLYGCFYCFYLVGVLVNFWLVYLSFKNGYKLFFPTKEFQESTSKILLYLYLVLLITISLLQLLFLLSLWPCLASIQTYTRWRTRRFLGYKEEIETLWLMVCCCDKCSLVQVSLSLERDGGD